jgi:hypothetical protein
MEDPGVLQRLESLRHGRSGAVSGLGDQLIARYNQAASGSGTKRTGNAF